MDWNWFFSALAQSTAAIVGLIGAFVFTKIVNNQAAHSHLEERVRGLILRGAFLRDRAGNRYFDWYNERICDGEMATVDEILSQGQPPFDPDEIVGRLQISPFDSPERVRDEVSKRIEAYQPPKPKADRVEFDSLGIPRSAFTIPTPVPITATLRSHELLDSTQEERELIDALVTDIRHHVALARDAKATVESNPFASNLVRNATLLLGLLFLVGVIYPLSLTPWPMDLDPSSETLSFGAFFPTVMSLKGALLLVVSLGVLALAGVFLGINRRLVFNPDQVKELENLTKMEWYSPFLSSVQPDS